MAIFDEVIHQRAETVVVDSKKRETFQQVKLLNPHNVYSGSFNGVIEADTVNAKNGSLSNVTVFGCTLLNKNGEEINLDVAEEVKTLKGDFEALEHSVETTMDNKIAEGLANQKGVLTALIQNLSGIIEDDLDLSVQNLVSSDSFISGECDKISAYGISVHNEVLSVLSTLDDISSYLSGQIGELSGNFLNDDSVIREQLRISVDELIEADNALLQKITEQTEAFMEADQRLDGRIDKVIQSVDTEFSNVRQEIRDATEDLKDLDFDSKHFEMVTDINAIGYPYFIKEHSSTKIVDDLHGKLIKDQNGKYLGYWITEGSKFKTFNTDFNSLPVKPNHVYEVELNQTYDVEDNYRMKLIRSGESYVISFDYTGGGIYKLIYNGADPETSAYIGRLANVYPAETDPQNIVSGEFKITSTDPRFADYCNFYGKTFNQGETTIIPGSENQIEYVGNGQFIFNSGIKTETFCSLNDQNGQEKAKIMSGDVQLDADDLISRIKITENGRSTYLDRSSNFSSEDETHTLLSATVEGDQVSLKKINLKAQYKSDCFSNNNDYADIVVPVLNTKLEDYTGELLSVVIKDSNVDKINKTYALQYDEDSPSYLWKVQEDIDSDNTITIEVTRSTLTIFGQIDGAQYHGVYSISKISEVYNPEEAYSDVVWETVAKDIVSDSSYVTQEIPSVYYEVDVVYGEDPGKTSYECLTETNSQTVQLSLQNISKNNLSRRFFVTLNINTGDVLPEMLKLDVRNEDGTGINFFTQRNHTDIYINPNQPVTLEFIEVSKNNFLVMDMNDYEEWHIDDLIKNSLQNLSNDLSGSVDMISGLLCSEIQYLSNDISGSVDVISGLLCAEIKNLSNDLSTSVDHISSYLSTDYKTKIENLSNGISGSVDMISNLICTEIGTLSTNLSNSVTELTGILTGDINTTSVDLENLSSRYYHTFDVGHTVNGTEVDLLKITDENSPYTNYKLLFKDGTLVLQKII